jgi:predicted amidohydrolase YtcJ
LLPSIALGIALGIVTAARAADPPADLVVLNGKVWTGEPGQKTVEAVAIRDGVFVRVGSNADVKPLVGSATRVVDAAGKVVVPGLIESHVHSLGVARGELTRPFTQLFSIAEIQQWVREQAAKSPPGTWIQIPRADITRLHERRYPTRAELDEASTDHPVVYNWQYAKRQVQILNTAALKAAGITASTPDPQGGKIIKGHDGQPTGRIDNSHGLLAKYFPTPTIAEEDYLATVEKVLRKYHEIGITSVIERRTDVAGYRTYEKLYKQGRLPVRINVTIGIDPDGSVADTERVIKELPFKFGDGDDWLRVGPLKIMVDGGSLYGTAYLREPYSPQAQAFYGFSDPKYQGVLNYTGEQLKNMIRTGHRLGWQMCSHVAGDGGVDLVLDAVEAANRDKPIRDKRYTLVHGYFPHPDSTRRAAELGVCVDTQPVMYHLDGDALSTALGVDLVSQYQGLGTYLRGGIKVAINADHMQGMDPNRSLNPYNPFLAMYVAVSRKTKGGQIFGPEQKVSREDALRMVTSNAAYLSFDETRKGSIGVGKLGDLTILTDDLWTCPEERIKDIRVLTTILGGRVVYEAKPGSKSE